MRRPRILAVDDDERNLLAIREVLAGTGDVVCAQSGEEALRFLLKEEFAVILLDVLMPGLDGYETAALVRQREQSKSTPIIFLTAINKEDAHMLRGYDAGAVDYVFKPFDPVMLRSKVSVFVELYEKTKQIEQKAIREQKLLEEALKSQSEKLEAIRELRRSEERQKTILNSLPVCFHARGDGSTFAAHYVSKASRRVTGFPPERFISRSPAFRAQPCAIADDLVRLQPSLGGREETGFLFLRVPLAMRGRPVQVPAGPGRVFASRAWRGAGASGHDAGCERAAATGGSTPAIAAHGRDRPAHRRTGPRLQ